MKISLNITNSQVRWEVLILWKNCTRWCYEKWTCCEPLIL